MSEHDKLAEARVGAGPVALPRPLESAAEMADLVRQVRIDHAPQLEDDDQGPFLHFSDASGIVLACWPRIIAALSAARAEGAAEAYKEASELMHAASLEQVKAGDDAGAVALTAGALLIEGHAQLKALAEREVRT